MANITRKQLINALIATTDPAAVAAALNATAEDTATALDGLSKSNNRKRVSKPSAETLKNRALAEDCAAEVNARGIEVTAADVAGWVTDSDGMAMSTRKVGALLKNAASMGLIAKSPEKWDVAHYAPVGFEFAVKPKRVKKSKKDENADENADA